MKILIVIALFACATAFRLPPAYKQVLQRPRAWQPRWRANEDKIVGGSEAPKHGYPFIVSLQTSSGFHYCGGSIIANNKVLTAAHCTKGDKASAIYVVAGEHNLFQNDGTEQTRQVSKKVEDKGYRSRTLENDYSVLTLGSALTLNSAVAVINLATVEPTSGKVIVAGWGTLSAGGNSPAQLQHVEIDIVSRSECQGDYTQYDITESMICAARAGKDSCQGDSGGPLVSSDKGTLYGVVSWGIGCADPKYPGVYANVAHKNSWISSQ